MSRSVLPKLKTTRKPTALSKAADLCLCQLPTECVAFDCTQAMRCWAAALCILFSSFHCIAVKAPDATSSCQSRLPELSIILSVGTKTGAFAQQWFVLSPAVAADIQFSLACRARGSSTSRSTGGTPTRAAAPPSPPTLWVVPCCYGPAVPDLACQWMRLSSSSCQ